MNNKVSRTVLKFVACISRKISLNFPGKIKNLANKNLHVYKTKLKNQFTGKKNELKTLCFLQPIIFCESPKITKLIENLSDCLWQRILKLFDLDIFDFSLFSPRRLHCASLP